MLLHNPNQARTLWALHWRSTSESQLPLFRKEPKTTYPTIRKRTDDQRNNSWHVTLRFTGHQESFWDLWCAQPRRILFTDCKFVSKRALKRENHLVCLSVSSWQCRGCWWRGSNRNPHSCHPNPHHTATSFKHLTTQKPAETFRAERRPRALLPKGSMYSSSIYLGLKVVLFIGTLGPKYILFGHMDP